MGTDDDFRKLKKRIREIGAIPTLPIVATKVMEMASNPKSSMKDLARVVAMDAALTGKILKVANSPFYGAANKIGSLQLAITLLGIREIIHLISSISVMNAFPAKTEAPCFDRRAFWRHSVACGVVARIITKLLGINFRGEEFTAGLLHDVGKIVLDQYFHEEFSQVMAFMTQGMPSTQAEEQIFAANHAQVGGWLAKNWKFPSTIGETIAWHHMPEDAIEGQELTTIIYFADILCHKMGQGFGNLTWQLELQYSEGWQLLQQTVPRTRNLGIDTIIHNVENAMDKINGILTAALQ